MTPQNSRVFLNECFPQELLRHPRDPQRVEIKLAITAPILAQDPPRVCRVVAGAFKRDRQ
jgi:hypothetical protein